MAITRMMLWAMLIIVSGPLIGSAAGEVKPKAKIFEALYSGTGSWDADSLGNHRAVLRVTQPAAAVFARIPWRRRDHEPEKKNALVVDATTGARIRNVHWLTVNREFSDVVFQPRTVPGEYYVYYMPSRMKGSRNYPKGYYLPWESTADSAWLVNQSLQHWFHSSPPSLPAAEFVQMQSIDRFNSYFPMEFIAAAAEVRQMMADRPGDQYLLFPEARENPIRMTTDLPYKWILEGPGKPVTGSADRGEFFAFQIGLFAARTAIRNVNVTISDLRSRSGRVISSSGFMSFNTGGVDWSGKPFRKVCAVEQGKIQPLWMGVQVPPDATPGRYDATIIVAPEGLRPSGLNVVLNVTNDAVRDHGDGDPSRLTRLRWLNSQIAADDGIVPPFSPVIRRGNVVSILGRNLVLSRSGFPMSIASSFTPEVTHLGNERREMLAGPIRLVIEREQGGPIHLRSAPVAFVRETEGLVSWSGRSTAGVFDVAVDGAMEFDGFVDFRVTLTARDEASLHDIRLEIPLEKSVARYMMGMGVKGGERPERFSWAWDVRKNQDAVWVGDVNAGLQLSFRDENYVRPLNTNFYLSRPLNMPPSWSNGGRGGFRFDAGDSGKVILQSFSGPRKVAPGEKLHFNWSMLLTPFKCVDTDNHWRTRYYHKYVPVEEIRRSGANTINVHHATEANPYINYPFLRPEAMKHYVDSAHARALKVKIYYTVRELSSRAPELFALRSLGDEVLAFGPGGGFPWLQEHLDSNYIAAWFVPELQDAAVINSGVSRWHNYYVEGLNWLAKNVGIDGLYIDDVAFDRTTMKRVRRVLDRNRPGALIDLHSANQFNPRDGFANSANLYLEHFPYLDRIWFGEYFDYNAPPDYWLIEMSGIPFGTMGEMLENGGNPWRGMVYGMTNRLPWAGDPTPLWKVWDQFGMDGSQMVGYWSPRCPVKTGNPKVLSTAYLKSGSALISLASWDPDTVGCVLTLDWKVLGLDSSKASIRAPAIKDFQDARSFTPGEKIPVAPGKGWLLILN